jgi:hypothetical protein
MWTMLSAASLKITDEPVIRYAVHLAANIATPVNREAVIHIERRRFGKSD